MQKKRKGSLIIVGLGIKYTAQITVEAETYIREADQVLYVSYWSDKYTSEWIELLNSQTIDLAKYYDTSKRRLKTYRQMTDAILKYVRLGKNVCAAFYGHPGVFVRPSHEALRQARKEGFKAKMLPGISAEDCLFADLGFDPAQNGCQSYEATDFLIRPRLIDTATPLILWQIGVVGHMNAPNTRGASPGLSILLEKLMSIYSANHVVCIYEAAQYPNHEPLIQRASLENVPNAKVTPISTMFVPRNQVQSLDKKMLDRLGLSLDDLKK